MAVTTSEEIEGAHCLHQSTEDPISLQYYLYRSAVFPQSDSVDATAPQLAGSAWGPISLSLPTLSIPDPGSNFQTNRDMLSPSDLSFYSNPYDGLSPLKSPDLWQLPCFLQEQFSSWLFSGWLTKDYELVTNHDFSTVFDGDSFISSQLM